MFEGWFSTGTQREHLDRQIVCKAINVINRANSNSIKWRLNLLTSIARFNPHKVSIQNNCGLPLSTGGEHLRILNIASKNKAETQLHVIRNITK